PVPGGFEQVGLVAAAGPKVRSPTFVRRTCDVAQQECVEPNPGLGRDRIAPEARFPEDAQTIDYAPEPDTVCRAALFQEWRDEPLTSSRSHILQRSPGPNGGSRRCREWCALFASEPGRPHRSDLGSGSPSHGRTVRIAMRRTTEGGRT